LGADCSLMKAVARHAIRYELGVSCQDRHPAAPEPLAPQHDTGSSSDK
jgi:hypothetical protein